MPALDMNVVESNSEVIICCGGEMDLSNSQKFGCSLNKAVSKTEKVIVDLTKSTFIDTAVLAYLAKAGRILNSKDKRLNVRVLENSHPDYVLRTVGFAGLMDITIVPGNKEQP